MEGARALTKSANEGWSPSAQCNSIKLDSFSYIYNKHYNKKHLCNANQGAYKQSNHPLSSRQNASLTSCPISMPCLDYSINVNKGEPSLRHKKSAF